MKRQQVRRLLLKPDLPGSHSLPVHLCAALCALEPFGERPKARVPFYPVSDQPGKRLRCTWHLVLPSSRIGASQF